MAADPSGTRDLAARAPAAPAAQRQATTAASVSGQAVTAEIERSLGGLWRTYSEVAVDLERLQEDRPLGAYLSWWAGAANTRLAIMVGGLDDGTLPAEIDDCQIVRIDNAAKDAVAQLTADIDINVIGGVWFGQAGGPAGRFAARLAHTPLRAIQVKRNAFTDPQAPDAAQGWSGAMELADKESPDDALRRLNLRAVLPSARMVWRIQTLAMVFGAIQARLQDQRQQQWMDERIADDRGPAQAMKRALERQKASIQALLESQSEVLASAIADAASILEDDGLTSSWLAREALQQLPAGDAVRKDAFQQERIKRSGLRAVPVMKYLFSQKTLLKLKQEHIAEVQAFLVKSTDRTMAEQRRRATRRFDKGIGALSDSLRGFGIDSARFQIPARSDDGSVTLGSSGRGPAVDLMEKCLTGFRREQLDRFSHVHEAKGVFGILQDLRGVLFGVLFMAIFVAGLGGADRNAVGSTLNIPSLQQFLMGLASEWGPYAIVVPLAVVGLIVLAIVSEKHEDQHSKLVARLQSFHDSAFRQLTSAITTGFESTNEALLNEMKKSSGQLKEILDQQKQDIEDRLTALSRAPPPPVSRAAPDSPAAFVSPIKDQIIARRLPELQAGLAKMVVG